MNWFKDHFGYILFWFLGAVMCLFLFVGLDYVFRTKSASMDGVVMGNSFESGRTTIGTGVGISSGGKVGTVVGTSSTAEKWNVIVKCGAEVKAVEVSPERFVELQKGEQVRIHKHVGRWTGHVWKWEIE